MTRGGWKGSRTFRQFRTISQSFHERPQLKTNHFTCVNISCACSCTGSTRLDLYSEKRGFMGEFTIPIRVTNSGPYHPSRKNVLARCNLGGECLNHYLQWTEQIREGKNLLISYIRPHNTVGSQTISRWLCAAIQKAGVEFSYKGHSTRAATTLGIVLEAANWSSARTFEKHFHKPTNKGRFAQTVLSLCKKQSYSCFCSSVLYIFFYKIFNK